jgi:hypothetical protein
MARARDVVWQHYRRARRKVNERLVRAEKDGRLEEELRQMEREARAWLSKGATSKSRRKAK